MASPCEYIVNNKRYTEAEFKNFLLDGGLDSLIKPEGAKVVTMEPPTEPPSEVPLPEGADQDLIKMANEVNDAFVEGKFGLDALDQIVGKLQDTNLKNIIAQVKAKLEINPDLAKQTRDRLLATKEGSEFDQAVLMYDLANLKGREAKLQKEILSSTDPEQIQQYQDQVLKIQNDMMDNALANKMIGRTASTIFRLRQLWVNKDLTIVDMREQYMASKGLKELTKEQEAEINEVYNDIKKAKDELEKARIELEKAREEAAKLRIETEKLDELKNKSNEQAKKDRSKSANEKVQKSNERIQQSKDNLKNLGGQLSAGFNPLIAVEIAKIAAEKVYQGVVKFDELVQNVYDDVKGLIPGFTKEDVANHLLTKMNKDGNLEPTLLSADYNNLKKSLDKSEATIRKKVDTYNAAQKEVAKKYFEWQKGRRQDMMSNKPVKDRVIDSILRFQRFAVLSYPSTFVKLFGAVANGLLLKPIRFATGKLIKLVAPKVAEKAPVWGDPQWNSISKYYSEFLKSFSLSNLKENFSGLDSKELLYGRPMMYDEFASASGWMEMPGRSHGYVKSFIKNPEFAYANQQQINFNITKMAEITEKLSDKNLTPEEKLSLEELYNNYDVTNENVIERMNKISLDHAKWSILMNENKFTDKFASFVRDNGTVGAVLRSELPIVRIPLNFLGRSFAVKYGLVRALIGKSGKESGKLGGTNFPGIAELAYKGTKDLTETQADLLSRTLQLGTIGASFFALGYFNSKNVEKNEDGSYEVMGKHVPKNLIHIPEYESIISGAETAHKFKESGEFVKSYLESDMEIVKNNPFISFLQYGAIPRLAGIIVNKKEDDKVGAASDVVAKKIADMTVPGFSKQIAASFDTKEGKGFRPMGETIKRYPAGEWSDRFWQQFELGLPGLRKNVPTEAQGADIKDIIKDMPGKKYEKQRGKIIEKLKKINY
jgi:hypothetical protein